jgi:hypothetical protein
MACPLLAAWGTRFGWTNLKVTSEDSKVARRLLSREYRIAWLATCPRSGYALFRLLAVKEAYIKVGKMWLSTASERIRRNRPNRLRKVAAGSLIWT